MSKYMIGMPVVVKVLGPVHGLLFIAYCFAVIDARAAAGWSAARSGSLILIALLPAGPLVIDGRLKREDQALQSAS